MASDEEKLHVLAAVSDLSAALNKLVKDGRENYKTSGANINDFVRSHGREDLHGLLTLYPVQLYAQCFKSLGLNSRKDLECLWSRHFSDEEMQGSVAELLSAEEGYEAFIGELDEIMAAHEEGTALPVAAKGGYLQSGATFTEASTGDTVSLTDILRESAYTLFVLRKHYV